MVDYQKLADYPLALEEIGLAQFDQNTLVGVAGFNTGGVTGFQSARDFYQKKNKAGIKRATNLGKPSKYRRGFSNSAFYYLIDQNKWAKLPKFPGKPRQAVRMIGTGSGQVYVWGGFSYLPSDQVAKTRKPENWPNKTDFFSYADGYCLSQDSANGKFVWTRLPDLPSNLSNFSLAYDQESCYLVNGACHHPKIATGKLETQVDGQEIGMKVYQFLFNDWAKGWVLVAGEEFPGTPRLNSASCLHHGRLFVIGGINVNPAWSYKVRLKVPRYYTVKDNWCYDLAVKKWSRLPITPIDNGNFGVCQTNIWRDRYLILLGGAHFPQVKLDREIKPAEPSQSLIRGVKEGTIYQGEIKLDTFLFFDLVEEKFLDLDLRLFNFTNLPSYLVNGDQIYILAGEQVPICFQGDYYGLHPDLFLKAKLRSHDLDL